MKDEIFLYLCINGTGAYYSPKISKFSKNGDKWYENFLGKVPENTEIVEFLKSESFNGKFWKLWDGSQMEWKFPGKNFRKFGYTSRGCPLFRNLRKFPIFYSVLASSFGRDHLELDISSKDDTHLIKGTLQNLSTYMPINTSYS